MLQNPLTETKLRKHYVKEGFEKCNAIIIPYVASGMGRAGTADVFVAHTLWNGWIEFKGPKTEIEPSQEQFRKDMLKRGVNSVFFRMVNKKEFVLDERWLFEWEEPVQLILVLKEYGVYNVGVSK